MAITTIRSAYTNTNPIASTGDTSQTWATKLATIATAYESLSNTLKTHSFISVGSSFFQPTSSRGTFVCVEWAITGLTQIRIVLIDLANKKRVNINFKNDGTFTWDDVTNNTTTNNVYLNVIP